MSETNQNISSADIERFKKIRYFVEGGKHNSLAFYILGGFLFVIGLIFGIILHIQQIEEAYVVLASGIIFGLIAAGYGFFHQRKASYKQHKDAHKRLMEQGVMYLGVITKMTLAGTRTHHVAQMADYLVNGVVGSGTERFYTYTVQYTDAYNNQKELTTYEIVNFNPKDVGKRCTVYEHEGKVIVDAVER